MPDLFYLHPCTALLYFISVLIYSMVFMHPVLVCINIAASFFVCFCICRKEMLSTVKYTLTFGLLITVINPLFNTGGSTVLFTYFGRNYTLQALIYGFIMGGIFICSINWFSCLGKVITADKFIYLFGGKFPNVCTVFTMVTGLVPFFQQKLIEINDVQNTIIKKNNKKKMAFRALSSATGYAFEHAINLSVSMKNRGFGSGNITRFTVYKFKKFDLLFFIVMIILNFSVSANLFTAAVNVEIIPDILLAEITAAQLTGIVSFCVLLLIPRIMHILKELRWQYLKSKI